MRQQKQLLRLRPRLWERVLRRWFLPFKGKDVGLLLKMNIQTKETLLICINEAEFAPCKRHMTGHMLFCFVAPNASCVRSHDLLFMAPLTAELYVGIVQRSPSTAGCL